VKSIDYGLMNLLKLTDMNCNSVKSCYMLRLYFCSV
jgi:hypothetical protein